MHDDCIKPPFPRNKDGTLIAYAWPGGYPVLYADGFNATLCPDCTRVREEDEDKRFRPAFGYIYYEGPMLF